MLELTLEKGLGIGVLAFFAEYVDSTLGMGYGTTLTPLLMLMGFSPLEIVPAVLLSELFTGFLAGFTHHSMGNVDLFPRTMRISTIAKRFKELGVGEGLRRGWKGLPMHLKITLLIGLCSIVGTVASVLIAVSIPKFYLKLYIGVLVLVIGIVILLTMRVNMGFSWVRMLVLGVIASFNKGMSGGGYGPVVTGGQVLGGVDGKNAVGITSVAEALTCLVGVITYFAVKQPVNWGLAPYLCVGAILSVPLSGFTVKIMPSHRLRVLIGVCTTILGAYTLWKVFA